MADDFTSLYKDQHGNVTRRVDVGKSIGECKPNCVNPPHSPKSLRIF